MQPKYGYPRWLNLFAMWMIVIIPLTKFGLCSRPVRPWWSRPASSLTAAQPHHRGPPRHHFGATAYRITCRLSNQRYPPIGSFARVRHARPRTPTVEGPGRSAGSGGDTAVQVPPRHQSDDRYLLVCRYGDHLTGLWAGHGVPGQLLGVPHLHHPAGECGCGLAWHESRKRPGELC